MRKNRVGRILSYLLWFLFILAIYSTNWAIHHFAFISFDEVLFQLTSPIQSTESSILISYAKSSLLPAFVVAIIFCFCLTLWYHFISCSKIRFDIRLWKKKIHFSLKGKTIRIFTRIILAFFVFFSLYKCLDKITFIDYMKNQFNDSSFIEENYVDPKEVSITFPEEKKNLIFVYVESLESTFFSKELGGESEENYLAPLTEITQNHIQFSDSLKFGGAMGVTGTTWTSGGLVAYTSGLPLKLSPTFSNNGRVSSMLDGAYTLGDILHENGYRQMYMIGSDQNFGNRGIYFKNHGDYEIYDYYTAIEKQKIDESYYVWWGYEDSKLFEYAKEEITSLASGEEPFNFTMLTANTHTVDGYVEDNCPTNFSSHYANSIYCSAEQIQEFLTWVQEQDFYPNTTVIVVGDHVSMQPDFYPAIANRRIYNVILNSSVTEGNFQNRSFCTMDMFPTTLASLGVHIEGERLGLGTNLFSDQETLIEKMGYDTFEERISEYSSFYMKKFLLDD